MIMQRYKRTGDAGELGQRMGGMVDEMLSDLERLLSPRPSPTH